MKLIHADYDELERQLLKKLYVMSVELELMAKKQFAFCECACVQILFLVVALSCTARISQNWVDNQVFGDGDSTVDVPH